MSIYALAEKRKAAIRRKRSIAAIAVSSAIGSLIAALIVWQVWSRADLLASVDRLVETFGRVAFEFRFHQPASKQVDKWVGPIRIRIVGDGAYVRRPAVENHAALLASLTGLEFTVSTLPGEDDNLIIYFVPQAEFINIVYDRGEDVLRLMDFAFKSNCFAHTGSPDGEILDAVAFIALENSEEFIASCIVSLLTSSLGFTGDSDLIRPSIFNDKDAGRTELSMNDKILVRTLYDDRIKPGMARDEAMVVARKVITELHAKVRAGEPITVDAD